MVPMSPISTSMLCASTALEPKEEWDLIWRSQANSRTWIVHMHFVVDERKALLGVLPSGSRMRLCIRSLLLYNMFGTQPPHFNVSATVMQIALRKRQKKADGFTEPDAILTISGHLVLALLFSQCCERVYCTLTSCSSRCDLVILGAFGPPRESMLRYYSLGAGVRIGFENSSKGI